MRITLNGYVTSNDNARTYRYFGYEVCCPKDVREGIANCPEGEELILELNSGGGSVYAGFEMYTLIRAHKGRTVAEVQSMAGSAMSVVMAACDEVLISPVANVMIHRSATIAWGNSRVMKETKQMLDTIDESILKAYVEKVGDKTSGEELAKLMRSETFLTAERAIELGLADGILPPGKGGEGANPATAVASVAGMFAELPPIEDLRRMEQERTKEGVEPPSDGKPGEVTDNSGGKIGHTNDRGDLGGMNIVTRSDKGMDQIETMQQLAEAYPDLVDQIRTEARQEGAAQAAQAERERILGIEEVAVDGFEEIVNAAKSDPKQNAATVAVAIVKAQKEQGKTALAGKEKDAKTVNQVHGVAAPEGESDEDKDKAEAEAAAKAAVDAYYGKNK